jgi:hypothetical protein
MNEREVVSFPEWQLALEKAGLSAALQRAWRQEVFGFLKFCKGERAPASVTLAKAYLKDLPEQGPSAAKDALRWFVTMGRVKKVEIEGMASAEVGAIEEQNAKPASTKVEPYKTEAGLNRSTAPKLAAHDRGESFWEQRLIAAF